MYGMYNQSLPKISIVTPSYNQGLFLEKTILSILDQGYPNLDYIIIDGGSSDASVEIIKKYECRLTYWASEPDSGQSNAINKGFARSTGVILGWLNSDDCLVPGSLESVARMYINNPKAGAYIGVGEFVDTKGRLLLRKEPSEVSFESLYDWLDTFHFMQPSCFFTREAWDYIGGLDESIHYAMDLDLWFKIAEHFSFERVDKLFSRSLVHASAKTKRNKYISEVDSAFIIMRHGGIKQARIALDKIASKLDYYEQCISFITKRRIFDKLLPTVKCIIGYDKHFRATSGDLK
jgi:glycosyltransferase involved in cell wall biosynthesis